MHPVLTLFGQIGLLGAAVGAVVLALWLLTSAKAQGPAIKACAAALAVSAVWAFGVLGLGMANRLTEVLLSFSYLAWLWMLYRLFGHDQRDKSVAPIRPVVVVLALVELLQFVLIAARLHWHDAPDAGALVVRIAIMFRLLLAIGALVLVHNLYVGASAQARQSLRLPASALALVWLYDLNFYTLFYLNGVLPETLADLRGIMLAVAVAILAAGTLRTDSELRFRPSRSFAFQSFSLLIIGAYLAVMVVLAQGISYVGVAQGQALKTGFLLLTSTVALTVIASPRMRGWLKVTLAKNLFQHRYDYRAEWLRFTNTIGRAGPQAPPLPQRVVQAVADIADSSAGLLLMPNDEGGLSLAARWQWEAIEVPAQALDDAGLNFFAESQFILDLDDLRQGLAPGVPVSAHPDWLLEHETAWAMVPLLHYERLVGLVVLARPLVARRLDWEDFDLLRVIGRQLASYLAEQASQDALGEVQRFDEFNRRIAFVMHDIKNLASQLSLLASNAEKHADKPAFRADMLLTLRNSTDKLQSLLARLSRYGSHAVGQRSVVRLHELLGRVQNRYSAHRDILSVQTEPCAVFANEEALEQALVHLLQNAIEASEMKAPVIVESRLERGAALIEIVDVGCGMSPEFIRTRLFKPFHSSKPGGFGIGAFEARELVRAMGGRLEVESREGLGTRFIVHLPLAGAASNPESMNFPRSEVA